MGVESSRLRIPTVPHFLQTVIGILIYAAWFSPNVFLLLSSQHILKTHSWHVFHMLGTNI